MNVKDCIYSRKSVRQFNDTIISEDILKEIISGGYMLLQPVIFKHGR